MTSYILQPHYQRAMNCSDVYFTPKQNSSNFIFPQLFTLKFYNLYVQLINFRYILWKNVLKSIPILVLHGGYDNLFSLEVTTFELK